jgi:glycosyltransferase involved in cell wall biosynthesis
MRILQVCGGYKPIPPPGWGGVENIVWQQHQVLTAAGHTTEFHNKRRFRWINALRARPWRYDLVHLHHDSGAMVWGPIARRFHFPLAVTSHYSYAAFPDRWGKRFPATLRAMMGVENLIHLSHEIDEVFARRGYTGRGFVLPNGIDCAEFRFLPDAAPRGALVLGRLEERKKQRFLSEILRGKPVSLDLVGPLGPGHEGFTGNGENVHHIGSWTRDEVRKNLTDYAAMVLISDGEAHAGVLIEALAAGLSLVISPEACHNFDGRLPFIYVVDRDQPNAIADALERAIRENPSHRAAIRRYGEQQFDWTVIGPRFLDIVNTITAASRRAM